MKIMKIKAIIPIVMVLAAPNVYAFGANGLIKTINEDKTVRHTWMEALDVPYIKAIPKPRPSTHGSKGRDEVSLDTYGCNIPQYDNFCSEKEFFEAMFEVCEPIYDERSHLFGSVHHYTGFYKALGLESNEYRRSFAAYTKYRDLLIYNENLQIKMSSRGDGYGHHRRDPVMGEYKKAWLSEKKLAEKSLSEAIWRTAETLDKLDESEADLKQNKADLNSKQTGRSGHSAMKKKAETDAKLRKQFNNGLAKIDEQRQSVIREVPKSAYSSIGYATVSDGKGGGTVRFLSYPSCAVQFYNGKRFKPQIGSPACLNDLRGRNGGISAKWKNKCDAFVNRHGRRSQVKRWLNGIQHKNNSAPLVYRDFALKEVDSSQEEKEINKLEKVYGKKIAASMREKSKSANRKTSNAKKRRELDHKIKASRSMYAEPLKDRTEFAATLKEDESLNDDERGELLRQYDQKFNIPAIATKLLSHEAKVVRNKLKDSMKQSGYSKKQIERELEKFDKKNLL